MSNPDSWYDPPDDDDPRCECGVLQSEHDDAPDAEVMKTALEEIVEFCTKQSYIGASNYSLRQRIIGIAERGLRVVADSNSDCRKFVAADPSDDCDARLDAMREKRVR